MADLEKAIEEVEALVTTYADNTQYDAFRLILSANREMREALRPFSALADMVGESWTDETPAFVGADGVTITIGQLRKARSALTTQRGDGE
jgi:hypothetical protein